jgi:putative lipoprotein
MLAAVSGSAVTGTVLYRQRSALPAGLVVRVRLEDVSRQDASAGLVAETEVVTSGEQVPIAFALEVDRSALDPGGQYGLRATIESGGTLRFTTTDFTSPPPEGAEAELVVQPVSAPGSSLRGTQWDLVELDGAPVPLAEGESAPHLLLDGVEPLLSGSGGVNRLTGSFEQNGAELRLGLVATTMMAGPEPLMQREQAFVSALATVTGYRIAGSSLELLDGERVVARLEAYQG